MRRPGPRSQLPLAACCLLFLGGCPPPAAVVPDAPGPALPGQEQDPAAAPRATVLRFLDAVGAGRSEEAYQLLSGRWRAKLTPARLAEDLASGGAAATDRLARARLAARDSPELSGGTAAFPIGDGHAVRLLLEPAGWKLDTLE